MTITEEKRNLFSVDDDYYFAHCISNDFALGAGIAVEFNHRYNMREKLLSSFPNGVTIGDAVLIERTFNLVTKEKCFHKPTYNSLIISLKSMHNQCKYLGINKLAIPKLGCGLDKLEWVIVKSIIEEIFNDLDIEILVCRIN